ncbi:MFS transporter [Endozoicomonas sp. G2_2]|uniref:MFS transporter n=1 Tax=Endozoicomonas sp. G2_2 TaxID=2821092 RepID=UPI001ADA5672|nr:MFS transporter [Endozoicomonas sp. G2_2]MBO9471661.1 MFS transporter [Endozoicomonas sp. G2_2]
MNTSPASRTNAIVFYAAIILLGLNLRPIMAAVGPLLEMMQGRIGLTDVQAGLLTTIPVFAMGAVGLLGGVVQSRLGVRHAILLACLFIAVGNGLRWPWHSTDGLLITAALGGTGIAIIQALTPTYIKQSPTGDAGRGMALFTTGIMGGAALASASVAPIAQTTDWPFSLALWAVPAILAIAIWSGATRRHSPEPGARAYTLPWRCGRAWFLMLFFGIGTAAYTLVLAWLPPFYVQHGWSAASSGLLLGGLTICQVASGLILSSIITRFPDRRRLLAVILGLICVGLLMLIIAPNQLAIPAILVIGVAIGSLFPLSLIVSLDHLDTAAAASSLMGFVQGGGYIIASAMPLLAGAIRGMFSSLDIAWLVMVVALLAQIAMVPRLRPSDRLEPVTWTLKTGRH